MEFLSAMFGVTFNLVTRFRLPHFLEQSNMIGLIILWHRTTVYVTETASEIASKLSQKWLLTIFCLKAQNFVYIVPYDGPNTYLKRRDFRLPMSASVMVT